MASAATKAERNITAFLGGPDSPDIRNPIHSTEGARQFGFSGALVGGATAYGWAVPPVLDVLGEDWLEHGWAEVAFRRPIYPGQALSIRVQGQTAGCCGFEIANADGVCVSGTAGLGDAPWLAELHVPSRRGLEHRRLEPGPLTLETAPVGEEIGPMLQLATPDEMAAYARDLQGSDGPRFVGERAVVHPAWLAGATTRLMYDQFAFRAGIDVNRRMQHMTRVPAGATYTVYGHLSAVYERHGHHCATVDAAVVAQDGTEVARMRQNLIFRVAPQT